MEPLSKVSFTVEKASNSRFEQLEVSLPDYDKFIPNCNVAGSGF